MKSQKKMKSLGEIQVNDIINYQGNANQNYNEISLHTAQNGHHQKIYKQMLERV